MATILERVYLYPYQPSSETRPLAVAGGWVSLKIEERIAELVGESVSCFCAYPSLGSELLFYDHAFGLLMSPTFL